jgi:L-threonylcarbamoyladenylate synthase
MSGEIERSAIERAVTLLRAGGLVAFPTETVYGLGADAESSAAVRRIFAAKGRPKAHPLIVHIADAAELDRWTAAVPASARRLAEQCWPGPLTLVLRRSALACDEVTGGRETIALRVPDHPVALALLRSFGGGIAAPSANRFGAVSPTTAAHVRADLGDAVDLVLDGGPCAVGLESSIVDLSRGDDDPVLLRAGGHARETLERVLGRTLPDAGDDAVASPGRLASHYAPRARVHVVDAPGIDAAIAEHHGERIAVLRIGGAGPGGWVELGDRIEVELGELGQAAHDLYATLRALDERGCTVILATSPDPHGLGLAIADRLHKAAGRG